ncbi:MAG: TetR/AcrR family transcriptional regulator [Fidelibacterota bacterium]|nr:MAG: TetR/AcrR family transcriptional regulator [Candidatus Neomarinimicrobiota bacterium]
MSIEERQQREREARVRVILEAANGLFARQGFQETSMSDIAAACELGKATLYYYFPTKEELYGEIIRSHTAGYYRLLVESIAQVDQPDEMVRCLIHEVVHMAYQDTDFFRLLFPMGKSAPELPGWNREQRQEEQQLRQPLEDRMQTVLSRAGVAMPVATLSGLIWSYLSGLGLKSVQGTGRQKLESEAESFLQMVNEFMERNVTER